jgi:hypothetical protein
MTEDWVQQLIPLLRKCRSEADFDCLVNIAERLVRLAVIGEDGNLQNIENHRTALPKVLAQIAAPYNSCLFFAPYISSPLTSISEVDAAIPVGGCVFIPVGETSTFINESLIASVSQTISNGKTIMVTGYEKEIKNKLRNLLWEEVGKFLGLDILDFITNKPVNEMAGLERRQEIKSITKAIEAFKNRKFRQDYPHPVAWFTARLRLEQLGGRLSEKGCQYCGNNAYKCKEMLHERCPLKA